MTVYITRQPENVKIRMNTAATFTVEATGVNSYTWQISGNGESWNSIAGYDGVSGANTGTLTINPAGSWHASQMYRCLLKDASGGQVTTDVVGIVIISRVVITKQPVDVVAPVGEKVAFTVEAENATYYKWYYSTDGGVSWHASAGAGNETKTLTITVREAEYGVLYRCELRDSSWAAAYTNMVGVMRDVRRAFAYTGEDVEFTVPVSGIYRLTVVGANGAHGTLSTTAYGGRSVGYKEFKRGDKVYVCCGQAGGYEGKPAYNGGGAGIVPNVGNTNWRTPSGSGGGATHIATTPGTLVNVADEDILIVAGGSGGDSAGGVLGNYYTSGGAGGGVSGAKGGHYGGSGTNAAPGTQNSGYAKGAGQSAWWSELWTGDAADSPMVTGGGGGGYWGGYAGNGAGGSGAGGSGYIGGVPQIAYKGVTYQPATENNYNAEGTDGYAIIELVVKTTLPVTYNGTVLEAITFDGVEIAGLIVDGARLFAQQMKRRMTAWCTSMKVARCWTALT